MQSLSWISKSLLLGALFLIALPETAYCLDSCPVPTGATYTIDEHSVCRRVTNGHASGQTIMVPTKTAAEWSTGGNAFINASPAGVTFSACTPSVSTTIATGGEHTCAIRSDGTLRCWGYNAFGQLGDNTTTNRLVQTALSGGGSWKSISVGSGIQAHSCGIKSDNTGWCWGGNFYGQLGDGTTTNRLVPTAVSGGGTWLSIVVGADMTCGIKSDSTARCWGSNNDGALGDGTTTNRAVPTALSGGGTWTSISTDGSIGAYPPYYNQSCGIKTDGTARCWGDNTFGQLGDGTTTGRLVPTGLSGGGAWLSIDPGQYHSCGIKSDGTARCWGSNASGQVGDGTTTQRLTQTTLSGGGTWLAISAAANYSCGIKTDGTARCWGVNYTGALGDGTTTDRLVPTTLSGGGIWTSIAANTGLQFGGHTCGIMSDLTARCWGFNFSGQLGDATTTNRSVPTALSGGGTWAAGGGYGTSCSP